MIIVRLMGGLGNQMFQYATARRLAHYRKTGLRLDTTFYGNMHEADTPRHYDLDCYKISGRPATKAELERMLPQDFKAMLAYRIKRWIGLDNRLRPLGEHSKSFHEVVLRARKNTYLVGWWQNEKYFTDIRDILLSEFTPKKLSAYARKMLAGIKKGNSVSIHVRRSDYISNKYANKEHGVMPLSYYEAAASYIQKRVPSAQFFIFSDDIAWCRKNFKFDDAVFVEARGQQACEDIYLMRHCQHNIVANSSFSWWGGWLNDSPDKIVIAPRTWFQNEQSNQETEIVPKSWTRL